MKRPSTYVGQQLYEWSLSAPAQHAMTALAKVCQALFGTSTTVNGLACTPTSPAGMTVQIGAGEIYQMESLEATACGTLPADTTHTILKQGIQLDSYTTAAFTAPTSTGQSIAYLIQAQYQDSDISIDPTTGTTPVVLQFYNSTTPASPWSGPNNSGSTSNTFRDGIIAYSIKAGVAATTGSQVTPTPDSGYVGLAVVTVAYGQTTITASNIAVYSGAPVLSASLLSMIQARALTNGSTSNRFSASLALAATDVPQAMQVAPSLGGSPRMTASAALAATAATFTDDYVNVASALTGATYRIPNFSATLNLATTGIGGMDTGTATASGYLSVYAAFNPTIYATQIASGATAAVAMAAASGVFAQVEGSGVATTLYSGGNAPTGYTATALIAVLPINTTAGQFKAFALNGRDVRILQVLVVSGSANSSYTAFSIAAAAPKSANLAYIALGGTNSASAALNFTVAANTVGVGWQYCSTTGTGVSAPGSVNLMTTQTLYYTAASSSGTVAFGAYVSGYRF